MVLILSETRGQADDFGRGTGLGFAGYKFIHTFHTIANAPIYSMFVRVGTWPQRIDLDRIEEWLAKKKCIEIAVK